MHGKLECLSRVCETRSDVIFLLSQRENLDLSACLHSNTQTAVISLSHASVPCSPPLTSTLVVPWLTAKPTLSRREIAKQRQRCVCFLESFQCVQTLVGCGQWCVHCHILTEVSTWSWMGTLFLLMFNSSGSVQLCGTDAWTQCLSSHYLHQSDRESVFFQNNAQSDKFSLLHLSHR